MCSVISHFLGKKNNSQYCWSSGILQNNRKFESWPHIVRIVLHPSKQSYCLDLHSLSTTAKLCWEAHVLGNNRLFDDALTGVRRGFGNGNQSANVWSSQKHHLFATLCDSLCLKWFIFSRSYFLKSMDSLSSKKEKKEGRSIQCCSLVCCSWKYQRKNVKWDRFQNHPQLPHHCSLSFIYTVLCPSLPSFNWCKQWSHDSLNLNCCSLYYPLFLFFVIHVHHLLHYLGPDIESSTPTDKT